VLLLQIHELPLQVLQFVGVLLLQIHELPLQVLQFVGEPCALRGLLV